MLHKNFRKLAETAYFKLCTTAGEVITDFRKSTLLWTIQEDAERVSTDRMMRFHSKNNKEDFIYDWVDDSSNIFCPNGLRRGQMIVMKLGNEKLICGQVVKFQYNAGIKKKQRYTYDSVIFGINKDVEIQLAPAYLIQNCAKLEPAFCPFYLKCESYVCHVSEEALDLQKLCFRNAHDYNKMTEISMVE